jgi:exonuclease III
MKFMFWNIRGFGKLARRKQIREIVLEEKLDGFGLQETFKRDFSDKDLVEITGNLQFKWVWKEAVGHSGGILMGIKEDYLEVEDTEVGDYYVSMVLKHRLTNFRWEMLTVYGPAQHDQSSNFIAKLSRKCMYVTLPVVIGGILT